jgi:hypothetical protein
MNLLTEKLAAIAAVKQAMPSIAPVPSFDIDQVAEQVAKAFPEADRNELYPLMMEACLKEWCSGMSCC